ASAFGAAVLCRLRRKNAVGLEYAERHSLFQLQLRNTFAMQLVRLFQSFHHRSGIREDRLERCERQSAKNRCRRTGIQAEVSGTYVKARGQKLSRHQKRTQTNGTTRFRTRKAHKRGVRRKGRRLDP